jgi:hypothetical protein
MSFAVTMSAIQSLQHDLLILREKVKRAIMNGDVPYVHDIFSSNPRDDFLSEVYKNVTNAMPVYVVFTRVSDSRLGNVVGALINHLACAYLAGLHVIVINRDWDFQFHNEDVGASFIDYLCSVHVHPNPSSLPHAREVVLRECDVNTQWYWEDPNAPWVKYIPQLRAVFESAFETELMFTKTIRSDSMYGSSDRQSQPNTTIVRAMVNIADPTNADEINKIVPVIHVFAPEEEFPLIPDVLIQLRCSDNFPDIMGMLPFAAMFDRIRAYRERVATEFAVATPQLNIYITTEAHVLLENAPLREFCPRIVALLQQELLARFPGSVVAIQHGRVFHTWRMMNQAAVVICSASTFCLWPALSNLKASAVYLPMTNLFGHKRLTDFGPNVTNVHFITDYNLYGIKANKDDWRMIKAKLLSSKHTNKHQQHHLLAQH